MNQSRLKLEHLLYTAAFLLALVIRLVGAGQTPLSNSEANLALQSLALARGQATLIGPHPAYLALTAALMFIFNAGNWVARFWPALAGSLLVLLPWLYRDRLGKVPALLLAFFLALDPGLLAASHQAGSPILALFFTLLAFGLWLNRKAALAGVSAGMALLGGPGVWPGIIALGAALWVSNRFARSTGELASQAETEQTEVKQTGAENITGQPETEAAASAGDFRRALIFGAATLFLAGTLFFAIPDGLNAMADSLSTYLRGWVPAAAGGMPVVLLLISLVVYELFPLFFGIWGGINGWINFGRHIPTSDAETAVDRFLLIWWAIALILTVVYPGRQAVDLIWSLLPLWVLAARQMARLVVIPAADRIPALGQMLLAAVVLGYVSMLAASIAIGVVTNPWEYRIRLAGALIMLVASTGLIAWGWSRLVALRGLSWGIGIILLIYLVSAGWNSVGLTQRASEELWSGDPKVISADTLLGTIHDLGQIGPTQIGGPDVVVVGVPSPALRWLLRGVERITYSAQLPADSSPAIVITPGRPELAPSGTYRGQRFILGESISWAQYKPADWLRWLVFRSAPSEALQQEPIILWARGDIFPGGSQAKPEGQSSSAPATPQ